MKRLILLTVGCLLPALAQAQPVTKWTLAIYNVGAQTPIQTPADLLAANVTCNQNPPSANASTVNPTRVVFDDPTTPNRVCIWTDPGTGGLNAVPFGSISYEATLTATNSAGTSPESNRASFQRPGAAPGAPAGFRIIR